MAFFEFIEDSLDKPTWDKVTNQRIELLHPATRSITYKFINHIERDLSIRLRVGQGYNTAIRRHYEAFNK